MPGTTRKLLRSSGLEGVARAVYGLFLNASWSIRRKLSGKDKRSIRRYLAQPGAKKLQLGAGGRTLDGWLSSDYYPGADSVLRIDATDVYPFEDATFDYIYTEHMIEHVPYTKGQQMLAECFRVLKPGGTLRVSTPDLAFLIALYQGEKTDVQNLYLKVSTEIYIPWAPAVEDTYVINNFMRDWGHSFVYDEKSLRFSLGEAGFTNITKCSLNKSDQPPLANLENLGRMEEAFLALESLIMEGTKPL